MRIICVDPRTDVQWQRVVAQHRSDVFHSPQWMQVLADTYDLNVRSYIILDRAGTPVAGLPCCWVSDIFGKRIISLPFSDYCDPLVHTPQEWNALVDPFVEERCPITVRCVHNDVPLADERFKLAKRAKWHGVNLEPELDTLWQHIHESSRRAIRKAQRDGVVVRPAQNPTDLRSFFELHLGVRKGKYGLLAQPYRFFENIWHQFLQHEHGVLLLASYKNEVIGSVLFLEWNKTLYYKFNASSSTQLAHRPNDLIIWEGINYAKAKGYQMLDFGLSDWDQEGLVRYKRKFATEEKTISFLQHLPSVAANPHEAPMRGLLGQLTDLMTNASVPNHITEKAGNILYKLFM